MRLLGLHCGLVTRKVLDTEANFHKKNSNAIYFSCSQTNKMLVIRAGIHKMLVRKANSEYPDQNASFLSILVSMSS